MSCPVCQSKDAATLEAIRSAYQDEGASVEELVIEFQIPYDLILDHVSRCITTGEGSVDELKDRSNDLGAAYEKLKVAVQTAHDVYLDEPKASNAQGYAQLVQQFRGVILDLQQMDSPEKIAYELANDVVGPLIARVIATLTEEMRRVREDLTAKTDAEYASAISGVINDALKRVGSRLGMDQQEAIIKIQKRFNIEDASTPKKKTKKARDPAGLH